MQKLSGEMVLKKWVRYANIDDVRPCRTGRKECAAIASARARVEEVLDQHGLSGLGNLTDSQLHRWASRMFTYQCTKVSAAAVTLS